ncbi:MAG: ABC transporter ATP-binding protein [Clostridiales bacterium]|jgi:oligopeptide/dipeptide ABC transporter ATP-binding protein|nr:ABC transporter ATP-binding protein [Clostridiales bacterium]
MSEILCEVKNLSVDFKIKDGAFKRSSVLSAVDNASFCIERGETFALVGESGCGKTTIANAILGFVKPNDGKITVGGITIDKNTGKKDIGRARRIMSAVFQDPFGSLNPRFDVKAILTEPERLRGEFDDEKLTKNAAALLEKVGLDAKDLNRNIFEFSGGQRQRIAIARALATNPKFIVCDEPTSALDVSVHAQICNLLTDLQRGLDLTYFFISHNLALVKFISRHMAVMYLGQIVEYGLTEKIFAEPAHPYTKALLSAVLTLKPQTGARPVLRGEASSPVGAGKECRFFARCGRACGECKKVIPELKEISEGHYCACPIA